ncbi:MAG: restriction endonuclease [Nodularia sp. CChRGM 3473]
MNTGLEYELKVIRLIQKKLTQGEFGIIPTQTHIQHKPSYYSRDRGKNIIFDVSIEVFRKDASAPFLVWIWECKNYSNKVPVDDVEEFHAKLDQVGADCTKGTLITPVGFDEGALEYARSKGIGLWRWVPADKPICVMDDQQLPENKDIILGLTSTNTASFRSYGIGLWYGMTCDGRFIISPEQWIKIELLDAIN